jgi:hypothetical protein
MLKNMEVENKDLEPLVESLEVLLEQQGQLEVLLEQNKVGRMVGKMEEL